MKTNILTIKKYNHSEYLLKELSLICFDYSVYKELGYPIFSDKNHSWYLIYLDKKLIGFCSYIKHKDYIKFSHDYILNKYREKGYYNLLFNYRLNDISLKFDNIFIKSICTNKSINTFIKNRFQIIKKTKNYTFVELKINK